MYRKIRSKVTLELTTLERHAPEIDFALYATIYSDSGFQVVPGGVIFVS